MNDTGQYQGELPPLPEPHLDVMRPGTHWYTADQIRAYAAAAVAAERERCALVCDARAAAHLRDYTDAASPLYQSAEADYAADEAAACVDAIRAKGED
jgi:hypothetical protein